MTDHSTVAARASVESDSAAICAWVRGTPDPGVTRFETAIARGTRGTIAALLLLVAWAVTAALPALVGAVMVTQAGYIYFPAHGGFVEAGTAVVFVVVLGGWRPWAAKWGVRIPKSPAEFGRATVLVLVLLLVGALLSPLLPVALKAVLLAWALAGCVPERWRPWFALPADRRVALVTIAAIGSVAWVLVGLPGGGVSGVVLLGALSTALVRKPQTTSAADSAAPDSTRAKDSTDA